ncbi:MAG: 50S ribosomal protein L24 [Alphaproteobacteria bacterium]|nr:50S ribosomal protein L24 [Alphaproteobacteria bacterium]
MAKKFKKGDNVIVITGSDKGKRGKIISVQKDRVLVDGINLCTFHKKPSAQQPGQIIKKEKTVHISNISHHEDGKPIKIKFVINGSEDKKLTDKNRVSKKTGKKID